MSRPPRPIYFLVQGSISLRPGAYFLNSKLDRVRNSYILGHKGRLFRNSLAIVHERLKAFKV